MYSDSSDGSGKAPSKASTISVEARDNRTSSTTFSLIVDGEGQKQQGVDKCKSDWLLAGEEFGDTHGRFE